MTNLLMNINKPTLYPNLNQTSPIIFVKVLFAKFFFNTLAKVLTLKTFQLYSNPLQCITTCSVLTRVVLHLYTSQLRVVGHLCNWIWWIHLLATGTWDCVVLHNPHSFSEYLNKSIEWVASPICWEHWIYLWCWYLSLS